MKRYHAAAGATIDGESEAHGQQAGYRQSAKGVGGNAEGAGVPYFALCGTPSLPAKRWRRRRSRGDANGSAERCRGVQAVQPSQARHDAGGAREARSQGERAAGEFVRGAAQLTDFIHIFRAAGRNRVCAGRRGRNRRFRRVKVKWSGRRDLNPGPLAPQASALARLRHGPSLPTVAESRTAKRGVESTGCLTALGVTAYTEARGGRPLLGQFPGDAPDAFFAYERPRCRGQNRGRSTWAQSGRQPKRFTPRPLLTSDARRWKDWNQRFKSLNGVQTECSV